MALRNWIGGKRKQAEMQGSGNSERQETHERRGEQQIAHNKKQTVSSAGNSQGWVASGINQAVAATAKASRRIGTQWVAEQQAVDSKQRTRAAGSEQQAVDSRQQTAGSRQWTADSRRRALDSEPQIVGGGSQFSD
ncbi:hypothetical protein EI94DRAFT_1702542 [Lactarius quietus]|nr:hypothetical protein EI94DRAFT_1702542 [Lactarius quietus]